jgi:hypothetical protein
VTNSTWSTNPSTGVWNTPSNWTPAEVPSGTATFGASTQTAISFSPGTASTAGSIFFGIDAPSYQFSFGTSSSPVLSLNGGVSGASPNIQTFVIAASSTGYNNPQLQLSGQSTAGGMNIAYVVGPETPSSAGGGVLSFRDTSIAGSASFTVTTGSAQPPPNSTVGGEVSFRDTTSAAAGQFTIYGSTGTDGDTFGNVVFHDNSTAQNGRFTNIGGTVSGGDGGNTQFYDNSNAGQANFTNLGGTVPKSNGGDVAFDGTANGGSAQFYNQPATVAGAYGGVTSFNNNPPTVSPGGASGGWGSYHNYGARTSDQGGGGHVEFTAKYGSPTAGNGTYVNEGSVIGTSSTAGHTIFSISLPSTYFPTAGNGRFWNRPAPVAGGAAGYTEFTVYNSGTPGSNVPTGGNGTFLNEGATVSGAYGGYTTFYNVTTAGNATLIAYGGSNGGGGGRIILGDNCSGGTATVQLYGNGVLDVSKHTGGVTIGTLIVNGGVVSENIGTNVTTLSLSNGLSLNTTQVTFEFWPDSGFQPNTPYAVLSTPNLGSFSSGSFTGNTVQGLSPTFSINGTMLLVTFSS